MFISLNIFRKCRQCRLLKLLGDLYRLSPVSSRRMMSSFRLVPPVVAMTFTPPMCLLMLIQIWLTCRANSRVGTITMARERESTRAGESIILVHNVQHNSKLINQSHATWKAGILELFISKPQTNYMQGLCNKNILMFHMHK